MVHEVGIRMEQNFDHPHSECLYVWHDYEITAFTKYLKIDVSTIFALARGRFFYMS